MELEAYSGRRVRQTQLDSYQAILPKLPEKEGHIFRRLLDAPMACFELETRMGWSHQTVSGRLSALADRGLIVDSGDRRRNPESDRDVIVWRPAEAHEAHPRKKRPPYAEVQAALENREERIASILAHAERIMRRRHISQHIGDELSAIIALCNLKSN